jgi:iron complex outermembrane receptor protein
MKKLLFFLLLFSSINLFAQEIKITGNITDGATGKPVSGASISVKGKLTGTTTDSKGNYTLSANKLKLPFTIVISAVGFEVQESQVTSANNDISVKLTQKAIVLNEVVSSATRINQSILQSPVSIEKMSLKAIKENPSFTFYDGLQSLKGLEAVTSSLTYKQINTRGFNSTGNSRFLQLVDGVDNQTPGLNF